uniref:Thyroxine-binding globulin n=1 Tax=Sander lucioperca TaxID=283035 RepID=A0A8C9XC10_SANLU
MLALYMLKVLIIYMESGGNMLALYMLKVLIIYMESGGNMLALYTLKSDSLTVCLQCFRKYDVYIPKFSIKTSYNLNDVLSQMGMTDMFGGRANLRGISEEQSLLVSDVVHKATLDVDEAGAEASAATGVLIGLTGVLNPVPVPVLKFNRPFMVIITERTTEKILFLGKIINPTI